MLEFAPMIRSLKANGRQIGVPRLTGTSPLPYVPTYGGVRRWAGKHSLVNGFGLISGGAMELCSCAWRPFPIQQLSMSSGRRFEMDEGRKVSTNSKEGVMVVEEQKSFLSVAGTVPPCLI